MDRRIRRLMIACACAFACVFGAGAAFADDATAVDGQGNALESSDAAADADGTVAVSEETDAGILDTCDFGMSSFKRLARGTNRGVDDVYYGYRFTMAGQNAFAAVVTDAYMIVYIPEDTLTELGKDIHDPEFQTDFLSTLTALDKAASKGGQPLAKMSPTTYFTTSDTVVVGEYTYRFGIEIEEGYYYATCTLEGSEDGSDGALFFDTGILGAADSTVVKEKATGFAALVQFFQKLDWSPLWVSLRTTGVAIVVIFLLGLLAAWGTVRMDDRFKGVVDTVFTIPMVLPPTVCGFLLLLLFGTSTPVGRWFIAHGLDLVFTWPAAVIACIVVGFPMMYRTARGAFENLDAAMLDAARTLGWSETKIFSRLMLPLAWPSIAAGTVLAFARAMGEFGCTLFFAGNYAGVTQTIPIAIYFDWMGGKTDVAIFWVIVVILISFLVILFINIYSSRTQRFKRKEVTDDEPAH
ncbi:molybdate ABC transporter permease subunit [Slackia heliotrinireducens]|uniref:molybdate ABC transporter permease subunit n=1 Tax=Slackia heliotrinireducens TaxID=84110 RepID=UPI003314ED2C